MLTIKYETSFKKDFKWNIGNYTYYTHKMLTITNNNGYNIAKGVDCNGKSIYKCYY